ncbi:MAG: 3'(2'),5'-bisphosphate nucleotidase CysQ [Caulobacterales bacterium]
MNLSSAASDLALIEDAAREAGAIARNAFGAAFKTWDKSDASPVTEVDLAIDTFLKDRLRAARADYGWLSEETADNAERLSKERVFIVDPIDGTRAFIDRVPEFCVSIGIAQKGSAWLGAVYNPIKDEMFLGGDGVPATLNRAPIQATARRELAGAKLIGRRNFYDSDRWPAPWPPLDLRWINSIAYRLSLIARGDFDGAIMLGFKNEWDTAGGVAIAQAAGARVSDQFGAAILFNQPEPRSAGCIAAGAALHPLLRERVQHLPHPREWLPGRTTPPKETT